jgi:hypothetical protein
LGQRPEYFPVNLAPRHGMIVSSSIRLLTKTIDYDQANKKLQNLRNAV